MQDSSSIPKAEVKRLFGGKEKPSVSMNLSAGIVALAVTLLVNLAGFLRSDEGNKNQVKANTERIELLSREMAQLRRDQALSETKVGVIQTDLEWIKLTLREIRDRVVARSPQ